MAMIPSSTYFNAAPQSQISASFYIDQIKRNLTLTARPVTFEDLNVVVRAGTHQSTGHIAYEASAIHQAKGGTTYSVLLRTQYQPDVFAAVEELFKMSAEGTNLQQ